MATMTAKLYGLGKARRKISGLGGRHLAIAQTLALQRAGEHLKGEIHRNATNRSYDQAALDKMGNPYARRHGSIRVHQSKPYTVHKQTGRMSSTLTGKMRDAYKKPKYRIGFRYNRKYTKYVITGTKVMLPRNILYNTSQEKDVRHKMVDLVNKTMSSYINKYAKTP